MSRMEFARCVMSYVYEGGLRYLGKNINFNKFLLS